MSFITQRSEEFLTDKNNSIDDFQLSLEEKEIEKLHYENIHFQNISFSKNQENVFTVIPKGDTKEPKTIKTFKTFLQIIIFNQMINFISISQFTDSDYEAMETYSWDDESHFNLYED